MRPFWNAARSLAIAGAVTGALGLATTAGATPIQYTFRGGQVTLTTTVTGLGTIALGTVPLT